MAGGATSGAEGAGEPGARRPAATFRVAAAAVGALLLLGAPAPGLGGRGGAGEGPRGERDVGPVPLPEPFPATAPFLALLPEAADPLPPGGFSVTLTASLANTFAHSRSVEPFLNARHREPVSREELTALEPVRGSAGVYHLDAEIFQTTLRLRRGFRGGVEVALAIPYLDSGRGRLDRPIERFHGVFDFDRFGREGVPRGAYTFYLHSEGRLEEFSDRAPGPGLGDVRVAVKGRLPAPHGLDLALEGTVELPTGDESRRYGSGATDVGLRLLASRAWGRSRWTVGGGVTVVGASDVLLTPRGVLGSGFVAWERPLERAGIFVQLSAAESPLQHLGLVELSKPAYILDVGWKVPVAGQTFVVALSENFFTFHSSPDVSLHLGWRHRLGG